jgi:hypothetical protein
VDVQPSGITGLERPVERFSGEHAGALVDRLIRG